MRIIQSREVFFFLALLFLPLQASAAPAVFPEPQGLYYKVNWKGFQVASIILGWETIGGKQALTNVAIRTYGLAESATRYKSDSISLTGVNDADQFIAKRFKTFFSYRKSKREIVLQWDNKGYVVNEHNEPPEKPGKRSKVPEEMKTGAYDPIGAFFVARQKVMEGEKSFTLPMYDGRRRSDLVFKVVGYKDKQIHVTLREEFIAGYTKREKEERKTRDITVHIYVDPIDYIPTGAYGESLIGEASGKLKAKCTTFQECLAKAEKD